MTEINQTFVFICRVKSSFVAILVRMGAGCVNSLVLRVSSGGFG